MDMSKKPDTRHYRGVSGVIQCVLSLLLFYFKLVFAYAAQRAHPVFGNIGESRAGSHTVVGVSHFGVIYVAAYDAYIFFHTLVKFVG